MGGDCHTHLAGLPPYKRPINTVFQSYALFPHLTVAENIGFGLEMTGVATAERKARVAKMLALVQLDEYGSRRPSQLSGGQQQRVALARALASRPHVLLLDEPLSALDLKLRKEMQIELKRLQTETGITFIFVTHDQEEALTMSDRIAVMSAGKILQIGTPTEIYEHPTHRFVADFIGETNFLEGVITQSGDGRALQLDGGGEVTLENGAGGASGKTTIAVRPERVGLSQPGNGGLNGTVKNVVYFGTDTTYHLALESGAPFTVRMQNKLGATQPFAIGDPVAVAIPPDAAQVLRD
ncbi:MAG: ABC transporter ATP-binding protein [Pseudomonadota bacterium]